MLLFVIAFELSSDFQHVTAFYGCLFICHFDFRMEIVAQKVNAEPQRHGTM